MGVNKKYRVGFIFIAEMYTKPTVYQQDYSCILDPQDDRGGLFIGNLEAAQNATTLQSTPTPTQSTPSRQC